MAMGTAIWLIFLIPAAFIMSIVGDIHVAIHGEAKSELVLPYNEAEGIVWEYDDVNDYYIELADTRIEGDKQIFVFQNESCKEDINGSLMDIVFTDKNGNQKKYYAQRGGDYDGPEYFEESECYSAQCTVTAEKPRKRCHWDVDQENASILCQPFKEEATDTFTIVMTPDDIGDYDLNGIKLIPIFEYNNRRDKTKERITTYFKVIDGVLTEYDPYQ